MERSIKTPKGRNGQVRPDATKNLSFVFADGPAMVIAGIALSGPIVQVRTAEEVLVVDDRNAGQDLSVGTRVVRAITHREAFALLVAHRHASNEAAADARGRGEKSHDARLSLGGAAVVSPSEAARLIPGRESENLRWLRDNRLVRSRQGLPDAVIIDDVPAALRGGAAPAASPSVRTTLRRARID